jgi:hypothetical protein
MTTAAGKPVRLKPNEEPGLKRPKFTTGEVPAVTRLSTAP